MPQAPTTTLTRQELYNLVWTQPLTTLAKQFGISDTGLRKVCVKMDIPLPKAGHWTKKKFRKKIRHTPLPVNPNLKDKVFISPTSPDVRETYSHLSAERLLKQEIEQRLGEALIVPEKLTKPDPLIKNTKAHLAGNPNHHPQNPYHRNRANNPPTLNINVTKPNLTRALRFLDTLIKALRARGHHITFKNATPCVCVKGIDIEIYLKEKEKRIPDKDPKYSWQTHILVPTGLLYLRIKETFHAREFADGKQPIEQQLSRIIAALEIEAGKEIIEEARRKQWQEESERKRLAELAIEKAKQQEKEKFAALRDEAKRFQEACIIRSYVKEVQRKAGEQETINEEMRAWTAWALQKADLLDPTMKMGREV